MSKGAPAIIKLLIAAALIASSCIGRANDTNTGLGDRFLGVKIGVIGTASDDILSAAMKRASVGGYAGLVVILDTPGGALDATRTMVKTIMSAELPVLVWVGPSGARAGSAGAFITMAAHIASMAPGTNIGAAHPIQATGQDVDGEHLQKKVENDTVAFIESIAQSRGRNVELARSFVILSTSVTAQEALEQNVIDMVATTPVDLLRQVNGKVITLASGRTLTLRSDTATIDEYEYSLRQEILAILSNPNLFYLLFLAGIIGLGFELTHPGALFPGVIGAISLVLALIATSTLPISFGAMVLTLAGVAFMIAEVFVPSFGVLGIGGFVAFVLGSFLLVDPANEQGLRISIWSIAPGALIIGLSALGIGFLLLRSERSGLVSGSETMLGKTAKANTSFSDRTGTVIFDGEIWSARTSSEEKTPIQQDEVVIIKERDGLTLVVGRSEK